MSNDSMREYFDSIAESRPKWRKRNRYYNALLEKYFKFIVPAGSKVLEVGCGTGELLNAVQPAKGVGIDYSEKMVKIASVNFKDLTFYIQDAEDIKLNETFEYIILSDLLSSVQDVQKVFKCLKEVADENTRIIISNYSYLWEPFLKLGEGIGLKQKQPLMNWLSAKDIENLLSLEGFEVIKSERKILFPKKIPLISAFLNSFVINLPFIKNLSLVNLLIVRKQEAKREEHSVTIVVPARNEKGNIESAITRTPAFGTFQEFIFIEGGSKDGTYEEILRVKEKYKDMRIVEMKQSGKGKGNAVREAFAAATGDVLMILDADLTMPPEDLPKYYEALVSNKGEFINGCRLVYPMEGQAMRFLNLIANKFFGVLFTYMLGQNLKDTLCGTKVLYKKDYEHIINNRKYFGDFDPFGDFDLLFGASKLNMKIVEMPIRYKDRQYGETQIKRFSHGWLLIKMSLFAAKKMKFI
ncbi:MAG: glycosyltransferase [Ignavibacteriae bacterium]|nr:glycosyltransferase [Ignavibacteriota bacterium]